MRDPIPLDVEDEQNEPRPREPIGSPASRARRRAVVAMITIALSAAVVAFVYRTDPKSDALVLVMIMLSCGMFSGAACAWLGGRRSRVEGSVE